MAKPIQTDLWAGGVAGLQEAIEKRCGGQVLFNVGEIAALFSVSPKAVLGWIEEGRLVASDFNQGTVNKDTGKKRRPFYKATKKAVLDFAEKVEMGW